MDSQITEYQFRKYVFWGIIFILLLLSYFIIRPFIVAIISAFVLAYLTLPIYKRLEKITGKSFSALLCVILIIIIILLPLSLIIGILMNQISISFNLQEVQSAIEKLLSLPFLRDLNINPKALLDYVLNTLLSFTKSAISFLPTLIISIFVTLVSTYYLLKDWDSFTKAVKSYIPFKDKENISKELGETTNKIIYGYVLVALIEFVIAFIGFYLAGVRFFVLLPALIAIFAFLPGLGPGLVWIPTALVLAFSQDYTSALIIAITGLIISIGIDNILAPKLVGGRAKIHPLIMLIGILGGVAVFGIFGFIIGPLLLTYTYKLLEEAIAER